MIKKIFHYIAHILNINEGTIVFRKNKERWMIGFFCFGCNKIVKEFEMSFQDELLR